MSGKTSSDQDIKNEARIVSSIQESGGHENIIKILNHGWLKGSVNVYFIDMELADFTLADYIDSRNVNESSTVDFDRIKSSMSALVPKNCSLPQRLLNTWTIGSHIARGLEFMHARNHVHRDLKPSNSICRFVEFANAQSSVLPSR